MGAKSPNRMVTTFRAANYHRHWFLLSRTLSLHRHTPTYVSPSSSLYYRLRPIWRLRPPVAIVFSAVRAMCLRWRYHPLDPPSAENRASSMNTTLTSALRPFSEIVWTPFCSQTVMADIRDPATANNTTLSSKMGQILGKFMPAQLCASLSGFNGPLVR
jgi:hypothetical protein